MGYILLLIAGAWWGAYLPTPQRSLRPRHRATTMLAQVPLVVAALAVLGLFALGWGVHAGLVVGLAWVVMGGSMLAAEIFKRAAPALPLLVLFATYLLVTDQSDLLDGLDHGGSLIGLLLMSSGLGLIALTMFLRWRGTVPALEAIGAGQFTQPLGDMKGGLISAGSFTQWLGVEASSCPPPRGLVARIHWLARHRLLPVGNMRLVTLSHCYT